MHWWKTSIHPVKSVDPATNTVELAGREPVVVGDLSLSGRDFAELHWLGFVSTAAADTAFHLDNLKLFQVRPLENSAGTAKEETP